MDKQKTETSFEEDEFVSKSQRKRESAELQQLGEKLVQLSVEKIEGAAFPESLCSALLLARRAKKGAYKRQIKYIGKLLRSMDPEPVIAYLDRLNNASVEATRELHQAEKWRDRLIAGGDRALGALLDDFPGADRQLLRQMIRSAQQEATLQKPPKTARSLFRYLKTLISSVA